MKLKIALALGALALAPSGAAMAAPISGGPVANAAASSGAGLVTDVRYAGRRYAYRDCTPYNGPYGYYGNPYCEGGFNRYGRAGGYEIDLTPYFDGSYYYGDRRYGDRRHRRWR